MKGLVAKKAINRGKRARSDNEYALITKEELKHFLQNRREVSDIMWDVDPPINVEIMVKPTQLGINLLLSENLMVLEVQRSTLSPFWILLWRQRFET